MASKFRTQIPRPSSRKRKASVRPLPPRPKGEVERLAVRRLAAMKYRLAGATYSVIAEKLTEDRAQAYADEHGVSFERAMKKYPHVSKRTVWDDVTAELEELRRETEVQRADLMALENARLDQVFSKALSLFANGSVPAGRLAIATMGRRCLFVAGSVPVRVPHRASLEVRGERTLWAEARVTGSITGFCGNAAQGAERPQEPRGRRGRRERGWPGHGAARLGPSSSPTWDAEDQRREKATSINRPRTSPAAPPLSSELSVPACRSGWSGAAAARPAACRSSQSRSSERTTRLIPAAPCLRYPRRSPPRAGSRLHCDGSGHAIG